MDWALIVVATTHTIFSHKMIYRANDIEFQVFFVMKIIKLDKKNFFLWRLHIGVYKVVRGDWWKYIVSTIHIILSTIPPCRQIQSVFVIKNYN